MMADNLVVFGCLWMCCSAFKSARGHLGGFCLSAAATIEAPVKRTERGRRVLGRQRVCPTRNARSRQWLVVL